MALKLSHNGISYQNLKNWKKPINAYKWKIPKSFSDKKCDGIVHCIEGEDETFETCKHFFDDEATIECNDRPKDHYDVRIFAIPCDNVKECWDGKDEDCDEKIMILVGVVLVLVMITNIIYHYLKWYRLDWSHQNITTPNINDVWNFKDCVTLMGDELADMKVRLQKRYLWILNILTNSCFSILQELYNSNSMCRIAEQSWILQQS